MSEAVPGDVIRPIATGLPQGLEGTLTVALERLPQETVVIAPTAVGIDEFPQPGGTSNYQHATGLTLATDTPAGEYQVGWANAGVVLYRERLTVKGLPPAPTVLEPLVRTFVDARPPRRSDAVAFDRIRIDEASDADGTPVGWGVLDTQEITDLDTDPASAKVRVITVRATSMAAWYRLVWLDPSGAAWYDDPFLCRPRPTLRDVGKLIRAHTRDENGRELGTFTAGTRPTDEQVDELITVALTDVNGRLDRWIPDNFLQRRNQIAAFRAAALVETSYFPEQAADPDASSSRMHIALAEAEFAALNVDAKPAVRLT